MALYNIESLAAYEIKKERKKGPITMFMVWSESVKDLLQWQTLKKPKLVQLGKVYKWFTAVGSEGKPMNAYDNWKSEVFLLWIKNGWKVHILWVSNKIIFVRT
jgi:hypothetical protein